MNAPNLRSIPSVDKVLRELGPTNLPRPALVALVRRELDDIRRKKNIASVEDAINRIREAVQNLLLARIQPVINGTGVVIHTNLGRSPLGQQVIQTLGEIGSHYNNLEYDLTNGQRGGRAVYLEHNLAVLCGAEAATVVNNCAAALILILRHFTAKERKQVIISRGQLVQIGGGFRIPDILEVSGATLREVGTTNKTSLADYSRAIGKETAMILKVHQSNFYMGGFVESPDTEQLSELAKKKRIPLIEDLGSGAVFPTDSIAGVDREPMPKELIDAGVDLLCFSGDKLLGGPQAGIIAGRARYLSALKRNPFFRALRCDKLILGAMQTTVDLHLDAGQSRLPTIDLLTTDSGPLRERAQQLVVSLGDIPAKIEVGRGKSQVGGGTLPRSQIDSVTLDILPHEVNLPDLAARLRIGIPPIIGFISGGRFKIDLRTVFPRQDSQLISAIRALFTGIGMNRLVKISGSRL
jgi:L-seryl-tRNA(Ser) seleniumtransferase